MNEILTNFETRGLWRGGKMDPLINLQSAFPDNVVAAAEIEGGGVESASAGGKGVEEQGAKEG